MKTPLAILFFLLLGTPVQAATYWVTKSSNGSQHCVNSASQPGNLATQTSATIDQGLGCMSSGDTLIVGNGTYTEDIRQSGWPSGSGNESTYTKIKAQNNLGATIRTDGNFAIYNADSHHIMLDGFKFEKTVTVANGSHHVTIQNSDLSHQVPSGDWTVDNCFFGNGDSMVLRNSAIHHCGNHGTGDQGHNVYWGGGNGIIEDNDFYDNDGAYLLQVQYDTAVNNHIRRNIFHDQTANSFRVVVLSGHFEPPSTGPGHDNYFYDNLIYNNNGVGLNNKQEGSIIYNNTFYNNTVAIEMHNSASIKNNIFHQNGTTIDDFGSSITASNNLCTTTCSFGSSNQNGDPLFVSTDPSSSDFFKLSSGSLAINNGADLGPTYNMDFAGVVRPQGAGWDIGVYEFASIAVLPTVNIAMPISGCTTTSTSPKACTTSNATSTIAGTSSLP